MRFFALLGAIAVIVPMPVMASVPPVGWKGPKWSGPGLLCQPSFTLRLAAGETAEQQYPSVGLIRYLVRSDKGVFEVAEDWYRRPFEGRELVEKRREGTLSKVTEAGWKRTYVFHSERSNLPILVQFDPLLTREPSFVGRKAEKSVLDRVSLAKTDPRDCLEPVKAESASRG